MAIFELKKEGIHLVTETTFEAEGIRERDDLQRLLRANVAMISPDTLVIAEEFGEWEDSRRRIDLLGLDRDGNLVVIELKRTEDGGHMELQALRYAAMVSTMTFDKVVDTYNRHLQKLGQETKASELILNFLDWDEPDETLFAQDVRIVLASADFSRELTTSVIWLNKRGLNIRCIRLKPYRLNDHILVDAQQLVPLPEVAEYQVQIREKEQRGREDRAERYGIRKRFWTGLLDYARRHCDLHGNISPGEYSWISTGAGMRGMAYNYAVTKHGAAVELYIDRGAEPENKEIFDRFQKGRKEIEGLFGDELEWQRLDEKRACRIRKSSHIGGYRDEEKWPEIFKDLVDAMMRLEQAISPFIGQMKSVA